MSSLLSFVGWAVLPNYATSFLQNVYYGITIRAGDPKPQPGSPRYARHRRRIFIAVVTAYLLYTLFEAFHRVQAQGDFYQVLGVSPLADERFIKSRFRRLAAQHHPDKVGSGDGVSDDYFVFGPSMLNWGEKKTAHAFLVAGLQKSIPGYVGGFLTILVLNFVWWSEWGRYWRFFTFAALFTLELALTTHPGAVFIPSFYIPPGLRELVGISPNAPGFYLLPFQVMALAQRASVTLHIFISQVTPPDVCKGSAPGERLHPQTLQKLGQIMQLSRTTDGEATRLLRLGFAPFQGDRESVATLRKGMKEGLVLSSVRASPGVQQAVNEVMEWKRQEKKVE
ncbi:putative membrane associated DnaJ chaperone [Aspergillus rambellii]|uniref:Putative membrane associated DnaJ chaperone n=1 Tax=Aspergillus rambellii TaxID=308745 RepID=A0A0F8V4X8_9EURO|nr:putative membrane associated DnaJ chaperone [Aspergillus rambellii]